MRNHQNISVAETFGDVFNNLQAAPRNLNRQFPSRRRVPGGISQPVNIVVMKGLVYVFFCSSLPTAVANLI
jgi:hypothetical protein